MSRDALKDAFIAGWNASYGTNPDLSFHAKRAAFDAWYESAIETLGRSPSTDATSDGWIEWDGSADMPPGLSDWTMMDVRFGTGTVDRDDAEKWNWRHVNDDEFDIVAYRVTR